MVRLIRIRFSGLDRRATKTAAVASRIDTSTKKCQGWNPSSVFAPVDLVVTAPSRRGPSIEIPELIVQSLLQGVIFLGGEWRARRLCLFFAARPAQRNEA